MSNLGLARRIGLTIGALLVVRLGTYIPVPGINPAIWEPLFRQHSGGVLGAFDALAGGAVGRLSVFALSIIPFVTASLLLQLASIVSPALRALPRRGESGRRRLDAYTLVLAIGLGVFQAVGIALALEGVANIVAEPGMMFRITTVLTLTGGVIVQVWLARLITARGIGNGFALILATGIVAALPAAIAGAFELSRQGVLSTDVLLGCGLLAVALTALVVHMELARRKLEATFARQGGARTIGGRALLQFKLNSAGMVPTILASWLLLLPILAVNMGLPLPDWIMSHLAHGRPVFMILYGLAIVLCAFFYTAFLLSPEELAQDLQKHGGVIPGVEPGEATADHIDRVVSRINVIGAVYLAFMFLMPEILIAKWSLPFYLGGPSLLIVVCAILDLKTQFENARRKRLEAS